MSLPGTPILYYGDEIGMGDNIYLGDRDGVRTPMQWSADRNAGFSTANPQQLFLPVIIDPEYRYEAINVATQQNNPSSLLVWMRRLIAQRQRHSGVRHGSMTMLAPDNPRVLAFIRGDAANQILVVANLSRFPQSAELDLTEFPGPYPGGGVRRQPVPQDRGPPVSVHPRPAQLPLAATELRGPCRGSTGGDARKSWCRPTGRTSSPTAARGPDSPRPSPRCWPGIPGSTRSGTSSNPFDWLARLRCGPRGRSPARLP